MSSRRRRGITLVETMVVLLILVLLATVAIANTERLVEHGAFEASRRTLDGFEAAAIGPADWRHPDGTPWISGFVADLGRLPNVVGTEEPTKLQELWLPGGLPAATVGAPPGDPEVRVVAGWRGPYLRLPIGVAQLLDGWGRPFALTTQVAGPDTRVVGVTSLGADGQPGGAGYDQDLAVSLATPTSRFAATLSVDVTVGTPSAHAFVVVRLYGPVGGTPGTIDQKVVAAASAVAVTFTNAPTGPRVVRAYHQDGDPGGNLDLDLSAAPVKTAVKAVALVHGPQTTQLTLP